MLQEDVVLKKVQAAVLKEREDQKRDHEGKLLETLAKAEDVEK